jgi:Na+/proline symporter
MAPQVGVFPILVATFFWRRATPAGVLAGLGGAFAAVVACNLWPGLEWRGVHPGVCGLLANLPLLVGASLATKPMPEGQVRQFVVAYWQPTGLPTVLRFAPCWALQVAPERGRSFCLQRVFVATALIRVAMRSLASAAWSS